MKLPRSESNTFTTTKESVWCKKPFLSTIKHRDCVLLSFALSNCDEQDMFVTFYAVRYRVQLNKMG